jgi:small ligand-binding sensory domain FIST
MAHASHVSSAKRLLGAASLSVHVDPIMAAEAVVDEVLRGDGGVGRHAGPIDLCVAFVSGAHASHSKEIAGHIRKHLEPACLLSVSGSGVVGHSAEVIGRGAVSVLCLSLPGTRITPFSYTDLPHATPDDPFAMERLAEAVGADETLAGTLFFADPFSVPTAAVVNALGGLESLVRDGEPGVSRPPVVGGLASAGDAPRQNRLVLNDRTLVSGGVGVTVCGDVSMDTAVAQSCKPIGEPMVVTSAKRNILLRLGGRRAIDALRDTVSELSEREREMLGEGLFIGKVVNEYKPRFGRGDFVVRDVMGVDQEHGAVAVADQLRAGQTVQFHLRDKETAEEDLELLLQSQVMRGPAAGGLLCTARKRGVELFDRPHVDASAVSRWLASAGDIGSVSVVGGGEDASVEGDPAGLPEMESLVPAAGGGRFPLAGFFAAGEIGPIGGRSFLNQQTASLTLFRPSPGL